MRTRARVLVAGVVIACVYVGVAIGAGSFNPLTRKPVLDGLAPQQPYRWVSPPPERAGDNVPPAKGIFDVRLGPDGAKPIVLSTADLQVTLIVAKGLFPAAPGQDSVEVTVEPVDPSDVAPAPGEQEITGNVYRIQARYQPSGEGIRALAFPAELVLVYPQIPAPPGIRHFDRTLLLSRDGERWRQIGSSDLPALLQVEGGVPSLGYFAVAARGVESPGATGAPARGGTTSLTIALVAGACVLLVAVGYIARRSARRAREGGGSAASAGSRSGANRSGRSSSRQRSRSHQRRRRH